jgi:hypothetical protein
MKRTHTQASHAMQSGVAYDIEKNGETSAATTHKHLRVGINVALCDHAALVRLLVAKGVITMDEYEEAATAQMEREVASYEEKLSASYGGPVKLG